MIDHIDAVLALADSVFGPDDNGAVPADLTTYTDAHTTGVGSGSIPPRLADYVVNRHRRGGRGTGVHSVNFGAALRIADQRGGGKLCNNTDVIDTDEGFAVRLHATIILRYNATDNTVNLNTAGWQTVTTKQRLNALLHEFGYRIYSEKFEWKVRRGVSVMPFRDGMTLSLDMRGLTR